MVKKDVKVKEYINIEEKVIITNHLVDSYFVKSLDWMQCRKRKISKGKPLIKRARTCFRSQQTQQSEDG